MIDEKNGVAKAIAIVPITKKLSIARDRLIGLAGVLPNLVKNMEEKQRIPPKMEIAIIDGELEKISQAIAQYIDYVIGMIQAIGDRAAIEFAVGFYDALGAGRIFEDAYKR